MRSKSLITHCSAGDDRIDEDVQEETVERGTSSSGRDPVTEELPGELICSGVGDSEKYRGGEESDSVFVDHLYYIYIIV